MQACQKCGSDNIKSFSIVYDIYSANDLSPLGYKCAPPTEPKLGAFVWLFAIASLVIAHNVAALSIFSSYFTPAAVTFVISMTGMIVLWHKTLGTSEKLEYHEKLKKWERSWLCMQCNNESEDKLS